MSTTAAEQGAGQQPAPGQGESQDPGQQQPQTAGNERQAGATPGEEQLGDAGKAALEREREARKAAEKRAKDAEKAAKDAERANMDEAQRAVAEAEERGRAAATDQYRDRLVSTEFRAAVARRNPEADADEILETLDTRKLADESGEPDVKAIQRVVDRLVPEPDGRPPSFDSGPRQQSVKGGSFNDQIRRGLGR